jgi:hypothetical protein
MRSTAEMLCLCLAFASDCFIIALLTRRMAEHCIRSLIVFVHVCTQKEIATPAFPTLSIHLPMMIQVWFHERHHVVVPSADISLSAQLESVLQPRSVEQSLR